MEFTNKTALVVGLGVSGIGAVSLLQKIGAHIILFDGNKELDREEILHKLRLSEDTKMYLGDFPYESLSDIDVIVLSPGISVESDFITEAKKQGVKVIGEIELAYSLSKGKMIAITGTNGKTTTTALVGAIMKNNFKNVFVVGNIGTSFAGTVLETTDDAITVAEISSFQLETIDQFKPNVSAVLNVTPDHLNRHHTMNNYLDVKMSIAKNQDEKDCCILNYEDELLRDFATKLKPEVLFFSSKTRLDTGVYLEEENIIYSKNGIASTICNSSELQLIGVHNYENVMAAIAIAISIGVSESVIRETIINFTSVEHRIEFVTKKNGVIYYNDSKGTNTDASIKAVEAMNLPTVLIAGGYDKGADYEPWVKSFGNKIKCLILLGETKYNIAKTAEKFGYKNILFVESLEEAVRMAANEAKPGDAVLLSPACASWGMFKNYEQRGQMFKEFVNRI